MINTSHVIHCDECPEELRVDPMVRAHVYGWLEETLRESGWGQESRPFPAKQKHFCKRCTDRHDSPVTVLGMPCFPLPGVIVICDDKSTFAGRPYRGIERREGQVHLERSARQGRLA